MARQLGTRLGARTESAVEIIFPTWLLLQCFARFADERPQTRIELYESVLSGPRRCCFSARSIWRSAHKCRPASSAIR